MKLILPISFDEQADVSAEFYILTGGPGAGKTTVLQHLQSLGYQTVPEVARAIIQQQVAKNGEAVPWKDTAQYTMLMTEHSINDYLLRTDNKGICFFDRGIPDALAYANLIQIEINKCLEEAVRLYRYNPVVFLFPAWEAIYHIDKERKQDFRLAEETCRQIEATYRKVGYRILTVPHGTVIQRARFILEEINKAGQ